ncbi:MAG: hypothetical protein KGL19_11325 [Bacteroidota bacterium]|nr:hypothetical protein [Bacteroidota bacterium]
MKAIIHKIQKFLKDNLNITNVNFTPETNLKIDLDLADWEVAYLLNNIENNWSISITEYDAEKIMNVQFLAKAITEKSGFKYKARK